MNFNQILNSVLGSVKESAQKINKPSESTADTITKIGGGAALAGVLSMVLGRNGGKNLAKMGSLAALGSLAYQAYQHYQKTQANAALESTQPVLNETQFAQTAHSEEARSTVILRTMIAAALSDGVLDAAEKALIDQEGGNDPALQQWLSQEFARPIQTDEIAHIVGSDVALASQVYLAARVVCQDLSRKEIVFLSQLSTALALDEALVEQLEAQAGF